MPIQPVRGAGGSVAQGSRATVDSVGWEGQPVLSSSVSAFAFSSSSQDADPSNLPTEPPHLGSVCRNDGQEAWSRPVLLGMVPGLRAKAQPCQPFTNVQCQQESWKFWRTEKRFQVHVQLMLHCRARVATANQPSFQKGLCHQAGTGSGD